MARLNVCCMNVPPFSLSAQLRELGEDLDQAVLAVLQSGQYIGGPVVLGFEEAFAATCGGSRPYDISAPSLHRRDR